MGKPVYDDAIIFEFLVLESFHEWLSWHTIKKNNFRKAFDDFDFKKIALYSEIKVDELLNDSGILRNKFKILATINNAIQFMKIQKKFGTFF